MDKAVAFAQESCLEQLRLHRLKRNEENRRHRAIDYRNTSSVTSMLNTLPWETLRKKARLVMLYKARNEIVAVNLQQY